MHFYDRKDVLYFFFKKRSILLEQNMKIKKEIMKLKRKKVN